MAIPRIFVSSTCYDLHEIRNTLRSFIKDFSYEPVMSEYGDVFYDFNSHIQDSCLSEIDKSQMYILIIGNNYGSIYHSEHKDKEYPDSVTLSEFRKSIEISIPKLIFVNKFVIYDYRNYKKSLNEHLTNYFTKETVPDDSILSSKLKQISIFDQKYFFPQSSYKYVFKFIDIITELSKNNAIFEYETFDEIKDQLKRQWAGFLYDKLSDYKSEQIEKETNITIENINTKITNLDRFIRDTFDKTKTKSGNVVISLKKIENSLALDDLKEAQDILSNAIYNILYDFDNYNNDEYQRIKFTSIISEDKIVQWLDSLDKLIDTYKWSKKISIEILFKDFLYEYYPNHSDVDLEDIIKLNTFYKSIPDEEKLNVAKTILIQMKNVIDCSSNFPEDIPF